MKLCILTAFIVFTIDLGLKIMHYHRKHTSNIRMQTLLRIGTNNRVKAVNVSKWEGKPFESEVLSTQDFIIGNFHATVIRLGTISPIPQTLRQR